MDPAAWEKGHGRMERRTAVSLAVTPEQAGLVGCWQFVAIQRECLQLGRAGGVIGEPEVEVAFYACSRSVEDATTEELARAVRRHWGAVENGAHHRRDVTFDEDHCRISHRGAAQILACLRNLALGAYELTVPRKETKADLGEAKVGFAAWQRRLGTGEAIRFVRR